MSKLVNISVDLSRIPETKKVQGKSGKGMYVSLDVWINDEPDQYGKDASVSIAQSKEEREQKARKIYVGNGKKLFGFGDSKPAQQSSHNQAKSNGYQKQDKDDSSIPF